MSCPIEQICRVQYWAWETCAGLCKFLWNILTNIWSLEKHTGLKLGGVSLFIFYNSQFLEFFHRVVFNFFLLLIDNENDLAKIQTHHVWKMYKVVHVKYKQFSISFCIDYTTMPCTNACDIDWVMTCLNEPGILWLNWSGKEESTLY